MASDYGQILAKGVQARQANDTREALRLFKKAIALNPELVTAHREAGLVCSGLGRFGEAEGFFATVLDNDPEDWDTKIELAIAYRQQGKQALCLQQLTDVVENNPQKLAALIELGVTLKEVGRFDEAEHWFQQALRLLPTHFRDASFITLLTKCERVLLALTEPDHQHLINGKLFLLLIIFSVHKKNTTVSDFVLENSERYLGHFPFSDICRATPALLDLLGEHNVLALFAKMAMERHSVACFLACLMMRDYYPDEPCLLGFDEKATLMHLLPYFCEAKNEAILKNMFTHLLQKERLTLAELKTLYPDAAFFESVKVMDDALKPVFQSKPPRYRKPETLKVALCISGQLRGYKEAFASLKQTLIEPLQPDIFVHTWQDVGFKKPFPREHAARVFQGHFLTAYQNLLSHNHYSYQDIGKLLPTVFALFEANAHATEQQLKDFYQTDFVVVEDDQKQPYAKFGNQQKMRYKISACHQLLKTSGKRYDLVIRLRPDRVLTPKNNIDWQQIADVCNNGKNILIGSKGLENLSDKLGGAYCVGDTFAIGSQRSMDYYATVLTLLDAFVGQGFAHFQDVGHVVLGNGLWLGGYALKDLPLRLGEFVNTSLKAAQIFPAIQQDLANFDKNIADELVNALKQDLIGQQSFLDEKNNHKTLETQGYIIKNTNIIS